MNRILDIGYPLLLENNGEAFIIKDILGRGASSVTYLAECNQTEHVLKECNPLGLHMHRDDNGILIPDTKLNEDKFKEYLERFESGVKKQLAFRLTDDLKNTTSNVQAIYRANGTVYIDMTFFNGKTYDQVEDESLYDLLRRMKALVQVIDHYHNMGYLHLDVKPQNIYAIPETPEMVMMFDFDSVIPEADVENMVFLSYTDSWAAPEQKMAKYRKSICKATDLFPIGEMIFYRVMGRHSNADERFDFSEYAYDRDAKIFENVNPKVFRSLDELFHKTICCTPANRVQTAEELIEQINSIINILASSEPYLISNVELECPNIVQPSKSLVKIHDSLQSVGRYFNKSTPKRNIFKNATEYVKHFSQYYDVVLLLDCKYGLVQMIEDIDCIKNFSLQKDHLGKSDYEQILDALDYLCNERTLIVINQFQEGHLVDDEYFEIQDVIKICKRLTYLRATILVNGSFETDRFETIHWNFYFTLLKELSEWCLENKDYSSAEYYIKKAFNISNNCDNGGELIIECQRLLYRIKADRWWSYPVIDEAENDTDETLWLYRGATWKYGQK